MDKECKERRTYDKIRNPRKIVGRQSKKIKNAPIRFSHRSRCGKRLFLPDTLEKFGGKKTILSKEIGFRRKMRREQRMQTTLSKNPNKEGAQKKKGIRIKVTAIDIKGGHKRRKKHDLFVNL